MTLLSLRRELLEREHRLRARASRSTSRPGRARLEAQADAIRDLRADLHRRRSPERVEGMRG